MYNVEHYHNPLHEAYQRGQALFLAAHDVGEFILAPYASGTDAWQEFWRGYYDERADLRQVVSA